MNLFLTSDDELHLGLYGVVICRLMPKISHNAVTKVDRKLAPLSDNKTLGAPYRVKISEYRTLAVVTASAFSRAKLSHHPEYESTTRRIHRFLQADGLNGPMKSMWTLDHRLATGRLVSGWGFGVCAEDC